jgi:hypothetical protein
MKTASTTVSGWRTVSGLLLSTLVVFGATACGDVNTMEEIGEEEEISTEDEAFSTQISSVTFKTQLQNKYVGAQNNGGGLYWQSLRWRKLGKSSR